MSRGVRIGWHVSWWRLDLLAVPRRELEARVTSCYLALFCDISPYTFRIFHLFYERFDCYSFKDGFIFLFFSINCTLFCRCTYVFNIFFFFGAGDNLPIFISNHWLSNRFLRLLLFTSAFKLLTDPVFVCHSLDFTVRPTFSFF